MQYTTCHIITVMAEYIGKWLNKHPAPKIHVCPDGKLQKFYGRRVVLFTVVKQYNTLQ